MPVEFVMKLMFRHRSVKKVVMKARGLQSLAALHRSLGSQRFEEGGPTRGSPAVVIAESEAFE